MATVNELRAAGAEAISINGQRIVANTAIRCVGPVTLINTSKVSPPFIIAAIGSQSDLSQVDMRGGMLDSLRAWGMKVEMATKEILELPPYTGSIGTTFALPELEGGD